MTQSYASYPCPICKQTMILIGADRKGQKLTSCNHEFHFTKTKSKKLMDRKYVSRPWGLELAE